MLNCNFNSSKTKKNEKLSQILFILRNIIRCYKATLYLIKFRLLNTSTWQTVPGCAKTNKPLKRASVRKLTTSRPWPFIRMLVGYRAPANTVAESFNLVHLQIHHLVNSLQSSVLLYCKLLFKSYLVVQPLVGYRYHPSIRWQCRTQMWASALTVSQSVAILLLPQGSGRHRTHGAGLVGSHRTGSDSTPAVQKKR